MLYFAYCTFYNITFLHHRNSTYLYIFLKKISVKYGVLATAISLPLCIYLYLNRVRFLLRSQDLTESFSEVPADVGDIFPQGPDTPKINDSVLVCRLCCRP